MRFTKGHQVNRVHGHTKKGWSSATYKTWMNMKARCLDPKADNYESYGAKGIKVCPQWMEFEVFLRDMGERPSGTTIDRRNPSGNYEPGNCRWASALEQARNRRDIKLSLEDQACIKSLIAFGFKQQDIAKLYRVSQSRVTELKRGGYYGNV